MKVKRVNAVICRFVRAPKTQPVWTDDAGSTVQKYRDHFAIQERPGRLPVQAEKDPVRVLWAFVKEVYTQAFIVGQRVNIVRLIWKIRQLRKSRIWSAHKIQRHFRAP